MEVVVGEPITCTAVIDSQCPVNVDWLRGEEPVTADDRITIACNRNKHTMIIADSNIDDEAFYKCVVSNKAGKIQCEFEVLVEGMC